jgi:hypothetical protein
MQMNWQAEIKMSEVGFGGFGGFYKPRWNLLSRRPAAAKEYLAGLTRPCSGTNGVRIVAFIPKLARKILRIFSHRP